MPEWPTARLEDVVEVLDFMRRPVNASERQRRVGSVPYYGATGLAGWIDTPLFDETLVLLGEDAVDFGSPDATKAYLVRGPSWVNNHAHVLRAKLEHLLPEFLAYALNLVNYTDFASFGTRSKLTQASMKRIEVPLPPLPEQRRIVDLVGALDTQISSLQVEGRVLRVALGAIREVLVDAVSWTPLASLAAPGGVQIGPFGAQLHAHDYEEDGVPVVMPQDLIDGEIRTEKIKRVSEKLAQALSRHRLQPGDLVLPRRGDLSKRAVVLPDQEGWLCGTGSIRVRLKEPGLAPALLEGLSTPATDEWLTTNAVGSTMLNLNTQIVSKIPAPQFTDAGRSIAECCMAARATAKAMEAEVTVLRTLRARVLKELLRGDIEVPDSYDALIAEAV